MKSILITGGSGFFGRHFARYCLDVMDVERVCIYSRNEFNQFKMRSEFDDDSRLRFFIGDVRDKDRLRRAMDGCDSVVHAAALKRIEVGHYNPTEMTKTNVDGTINAVESAMDAGIKRFVYLSSDKAVEPRSPYGHSKAMAESIVLNANNTVRDNGPVFSCVRYGNVAGSTGSVIPYWRSLKEKGVTHVPVTDPECTRFWMYASEAVDLVWRTLNHEEPTIAIPEWLPAFRVGDLAEAMGLEMTITGLGEFEKRHEIMDYGLSSDTARRMTVEEIRDAIQRI